jgi:hypothetical protein
VRIWSDLMRQIASQTAVHHPHCTLTLLPGHLSTTPFFWFALPCLAKGTEKEREMAVQAFSARNGLTWLGLAWLRRRWEQDGYGQAEEGVLRSWAQAGGGRLCLGMIDGMGLD